MDPLIDVKVDGKRYKFELLYPKDKIFFTVYMNELQNTFIFDTMQAFFTIKLYYELSKLKSKDIGDILTGKTNPELLGSYLKDYLDFVLEYYQDQDLYDFNISIKSITIQNGLAYELKRL
jgi:hypothetical protein